MKIVQSRKGVSRKIRQRRLILLFIGYSSIFFAANLMAAERREYSEAELLREQRSLEYSAQEWREIAGLLMGMDFQHPETDVASMKQLPLYHFCTAGERRRAAEQIISSNFPAVNQT